jgi:hypothetical protein
MILLSRLKRFLSIYLRVHEKPNDRKRSGGSSVDCGAFLLSCVLEADRLKHRRFREPFQRRNSQLWQIYSLGDTHRKAEAKYAEYAKEMTKIKACSRAWRSISCGRRWAQACLDAAQKPKGYTVDVPTGGGKTLASLRLLCITRWCMGWTGSFICSLHHHH